MEETRQPRERRRRRRRPEEGTSLTRKLITMLLIIGALAAFHFGFRAEEKVPPNLDLDYPAICTQLEKEFSNKVKYPYVTSAKFTVDTEQKQVHMMMTIVEDLDKNEAPRLADKAIRRFGQLTHEQNPNLAEENEDYYGEIFDTYAVAVGIATPSQLATNNPSEWYINDNVLPTLHTKQAPKLPAPEFLNF